MSFQYNILQTTSNVKLVPLILREKNLLDNVCAVSLSGSRSNNSWITRSTSLSFLLMKPLSLFFCLPVPLQPSHDSQRPKMKAHCSVRNAEDSIETVVVGILHLLITLLLYAPLSPRGGCFRNLLRGNQFHDHATEQVF